MAVMKYQTKITLYNSYFDYNNKISPAKVLAIFPMLDKSQPDAYNREHRRKRSQRIRACTGFDGGLEVRVAIRGPWPRNKTELKYKR